MKVSDSTTSVFDALYSHQEPKLTLMDEILTAPEV